MSLGGNFGGGAVYMQLESLKRRREEKKIFGKTMAKNVPN